MTPWTVYCLSCLNAVHPLHVSDQTLLSDDELAAGCDKARRRRPLRRRVRQATSPLTRSLHG